MTAAADFAGVARTLKQQAGVRSLVPLKDALSLLAQVGSHPLTTPLVSIPLQASHAYCGGSPGVAAAAVGLHRNAASSKLFPCEAMSSGSDILAASWSKSNCLFKPMLAATLSSLQERGKAALKHFTEGQVMRLYHLSLLCELPHVSQLCSFPSAPPFSAPSCSSCCSSWPMNQATLRRARTSSRNRGITSQLYRSPRAAACPA